MGAARVAYGRVNARRPSAAHTGALVSARVERAGGVVAAKPRVITSCARARVTAWFRPTVRAPVTGTRVTGPETEVPVPGKTTIKTRSLRYPRVGRVASGVLAAAVPLVIKRGGVATTPAR